MSSTSPLAREQVVSPNVGAMDCSSELLREAQSSTKAPRMVSCELEVCGEDLWKRERAQSSSTNFLVHRGNRFLETRIRQRYQL